jgi:hypothetical protein
MSGDLATYALRDEETLPGAPAHGWRQRARAGFRSPDPSAAYGVAIPPGVVVVDVDAHPGQPSGFATLARKGLVLPETFSYASITGTGAHHWYRCNREPAPLQKAIPGLPGIDLKVGGKGMVRVAGASILDALEATGEEGLAEAPAWAVDPCDASGVPHTGYYDAVCWDPEPTNAFHLHRIEREVDKLLSAPRGNVNNTLGGIARDLRFLGLLSESVAGELVRAYVINSRPDESVQSRRAEGERSVRSAAKRRPLDVRGKVALLQGRSIG